MSIQATAEMVAYCFDVVLARLQNKNAPPCPESIPDTPTPVFITWKTGEQMHLRGCIGNFATLPLREQLKNYAEAAAFDDHRFGPIELREVFHLSCTVSLLHSFEPCNKWNDWQIGKHGIRIRYGKYSGTYLPSVAEEQGWNHTQTMKELLVKAGYRGAVDDGVLANVNVTRYQISSCTMSYKQIKHMLTTKHEHYMSDEEIIIQ